MMPSTLDLFEPLEQAIHIILLLALIGRQALGEEERANLSLPCRNRSLGILDPRTPSSQFTASVAITQLLVQKLLQQDASMDGVTAAMKNARTLVCSSVRRDQAAELSTL